MRLTSFVTACSTAMLLGAGSALAGGTVAPVIDVAPIMVEPVPVIGAWQGAYAGGSLGYSFAGDDQVGLELRDGDDAVGRETNLGKLKLNGVTAGAHVGYRWQRDRWVFGPRLGIEGGSVKDDINILADDGESVNVESKVKNIVSLVMQTGYTLDPQTIAFGTFGVSRMKGDYRLSGAEGGVSESYNATGISAGFGVERMLNERTSIFGAYEYRDFGSTNVDFPVDDGVAVRTVATPKHHNIKVGVNFRF